MVAILVGQGGRDGSKVAEQGQHLIVGSVVRYEETQVGIIQDSSNPDEARPSARYDGYVLPCVLTFLPLAMVGIVKVGNGNSQRFDTGCRTILSGIDRDLDLFRPLEASLDVIVCLGGTLTKIGPGVRIV